MNLSNALPSVALMVAARGTQRGLQYVSVKPDTLASRARRLVLVVQHATKMVSAPSRMERQTVYVKKDLRGNHVDLLALTSAMAVVLVT